MTTDSGDGRAGGERHAEFSALIHRHDHRMRSLAYRLLGSADDMEDALQDAYLKAYRAFDTFRGDSAASTWLYRIVYNACLDRIRARRRTGPPVSLDAMREQGLEPASDGFEPELHEREALSRTLAGLPPERRAAVLLVDAFGYDYRTAARILGLRPGTVASRVSRARQALRASLSDRGTEDE